VELSPTTERSKLDDAPVAFPSIEAGAREVKKKKVENHQDENALRKIF